MKKTTRYPTALTIAGSDSDGYTGTQADLAFDNYRYPCIVRITPNRLKANFSFIHIRFSHSHGTECTFPLFIAADIAGYDPEDVIIRKKTWLCESFSPTANH